MATKINRKTNGCTFQWKIENLSHCLLKMGERIVSPAFIADALEGTKWSLWLYPMGNKQQDVDVYLHREKDCRGPNGLRVNYEAVFLDKDGKILKERKEPDVFVPQTDSHLCVWEKQENVFVTERESFLPKDTLTVQCTLWKRKLLKSKLVSARTVFKVNRRSFVWKIDDFSSLKTGIGSKFEDDLLEFDLVLQAGIGFEKKLVIDGISFQESIKYFSLRIAVINSEGKEEHYGSHEYFEADLKRGILSTLLSTRMLTGNKSTYLPNGLLSLDSEYLYSTGTILDQFCSHGIIYPKVTSVAVDEKKENSVDKVDRIFPHNNIKQHTSDLAIDMEYMYNDRSFVDMEIRTSTQTFPVHKNILSARSPVFRRMFSNDMEGKNSGHVEVTDLEDDILYRLILYMYTDTLDDFQMENACKLYAAAVKYEIMSLRSKCSAFLKDSLCPAKVCDVLILADLHRDEDLKSSVHDYILKYDKDVFGSQEWKHFMDTNPKLAVDIMYRKVFSG